ncbi:MAG: tRNA lysidine(34) synthetase TilS [Candidatus Protistobacter heckmanni]|nr:tRNA lysidine(34) synthetase TilS [Candidatus Protistobacter heckmanni]
MTATPPPALRLSTSSTDQPRARSAVREALAAALRSLPEPERRHLGVAFSGGLDSAVLLHALAALRRELGFELTALHVHHGLSTNADVWEDFCREAARAAGAGFAARRVAVERGGNVEEGARKARYAALAFMCGDLRIDCLLTAHHQDDQVETLMLQLLRGAGVAGLSAMTPLGRLGAGALLRPLLDLRRVKLEAYAKDFGLAHIEDESNADARYDRNALRNQVLPLLAGIRAGYARGIARSARRIAEAGGLLQELAEQDLLAAGGGPGKLPLAALAAQSDARAANLLRGWLRVSGLRAPSEARLAEMLKQLGSAGSPDSEGNRLLFHHDGHLLRAWRGWAWLDPGGRGEGARAANEDAQPPQAQTLELLWRGESSLPAPAWRGSLSVRKSQLGIPGSLLAASPILVRPRTGGERIRLHPARPSQSLKNAFQQADVPPWRRHAPLFWLGGELLYVPALGMDSRWQTEVGGDLASLDGGGARYSMEWHPD